MDRCQRQLQVEKSFSLERRRRVYVVKMEENLNFCRWRSWVDDDELNHDGENVSVSWNDNKLCIIFPHTSQRATSRQQMAQVWLLTTHLKIVREGSRDYVRNYFLHHFTVALRLDIFYKYARVHSHRRTVECVVFRDFTTIPPSLKWSEVRWEIGWSETKQISQAADKCCYNSMKKGKMCLLLLFLSINKNNFCLNSTSSSLTRVHRRRERKLSRFPTAPAISSRWRIMTLPDFSI